jgi:hypothetical protein
LFDRLEGKGGPEDLELELDSLLEQLSEAAG